ELDVTISQLDREVAVEDEEEVVRVVVLVPDELSLNPDHRERAIVEVADDARAPVFVKSADLLGQIDLVVHAQQDASAVSSGSRLDLASNLRGPVRRGGFRPKTAVGGVVRTRTRSGGVAGERSGRLARRAGL